MTETRPMSRLSPRALVVAKAIVIGITIGLGAANVWPILLLRLGMPMDSVVENIFLALYVWWAQGGGPPRSWAPIRTESFRRLTLSSADWAWSLLAAIAFAATIHAAITVLFRLVPFPAAAFHAGYDFSFISDPQMQRVAILVSAVSAGICEEIGFRGYMQRPIEKQLPIPAAIFISGLLFTLLHLTKDWSTAGMVPIVFGAGLLLGALAWASESLIPCMIGHTLMDIGLFGYWWTQIAGTFSQRPIFEVGVDMWFLAQSAALVVSLTVTLAAIVKLSHLRAQRSSRRPALVHGSTSLS